MKLRFPKDVKSFEVPLYDQRIYVATKRTQVDAIDRYMHQGAITWESKRHSPAFCIYEVQERTGIPLILLAAFTRKPHVLVHECGHLALMVAERIGLRASFEDQEPFCYLLDYLFLKVNEELKR